MTPAGQAPIIKNRDQAEAFIDARIGHGVKPGLERISGLLEFMGDPQENFASIHVAGTNGKTTVSRMVQQILGAHGLAAGGFTSPHLDRIEERFTLHGQTIDPHDFTDAVADVAWFVEAYEQQAGTSITYFEITAALAFSILATAAVDVAVVEVGLGGRLDATNVLDSTVAVITGVDIDHTEFLGSTIGEIAAEKAAIVKDSGVLVSGPLTDEARASVSSRVAETGANWIQMGNNFSVTEASVAVGGWHCSIDGVYGRYEDLYLPVHGHHQVEHLATAIAACEMFIGQELDHDSLVVASGSFTAPGRLEVVDRRPLVIIDGAHNEQGFRGLAETLVHEFPAIGWQLVIGVRGERDVGALVAPLKGQIAHVFATAPSDDAAIDADAVAAVAGAALCVEAQVVSNVGEAVDAAVDAAGPEGGVVVAGSLYVVGEVRNRFEALTDRSTEAHMRFEAERFDDQDDEEDVDLPE